MKKLLNLLNNLKPNTKNKRVFFFVVIVLLFVSLNFANLSSDKNTREAQKKTETVLGTKSIPTPTPQPEAGQPLAETPTPRLVARRIVLPTATQVPTPTPTTAPSTSISSNTSSNTSTPAPTPTPQPEAGQPLAETPTPTPTLTPIPTPTPTLSGIQLEVAIDYAGQKEKDSYSTSIETGQNAWEAVKKAVGIENIQDTDYGGDLGIFITGFNGINATGNQYYEFRVNGVPSNVGVSSYKGNNGDKLEFVLTTF